MKKILAILLCAVMVLSLFAGCGGEETQPTETKHKHTYATDWAFDATSHWLPATCEHTNLKANVGNHLDEDKDGVCDSCGWFDETHTHVFTDEWKSDATHHWHPADPTKCDHIGAMGDKAEHVDENNDGQCDICAYMGEHTHAYE